VRLREPRQNGTHARNPDPSFRFRSTLLAQTKNDSPLLGPNFYRESNFRERYRSPQHLFQRSSLGLFRAKILIADLSFITLSGTSFMARVQFADPVSKIATPPFWKRLSGRGELRLGKPSDGNIILRLHSSELVRQGTFRH
jgi:hypothetical protein